MDTNKLAQDLAKVIHSALGNSAQAQGQQVFPSTHLQQLVGGATVPNNYVSRYGGITGFGQAAGGMGSVYGPAAGGMGSVYGPAAGGMGSGPAAGGMAGGVDVVTHDEHNRAAKVNAAYLNSIQSQVDEIRSHVGMPEKKRSIHASAAATALQIGQAKGKKLTNVVIDDDLLDAKIEEILKDDPEMDRRTARTLAEAELSKPAPSKKQKAQAQIQQTVPFNYELWGQLLRQEGLGDTCPDLISRVKALHAGFLTQQGHLKAATITKLKVNRVYKFYVEMMPDPVTAANPETLKEFAKLKKDNGFPENDDWDGKAPKP